MMVETVYPPDTIQFEILFSEPYLKRVEVKFYDGKKLKIVEPIDGVYRIETPRMRGGYTISLGQKSNIHDPRYYQIIRIDWIGLACKELSIHDLKSLSYRMLENQEIYQLGQSSFLEIQSPNGANYPRKRLEVKSPIPKDGVYLYDVVYREWDENLTSKKVEVVMYGKQVRIVSVTGGSSTLVRLGEIIEEGELVQDEYGNWIILASYVNNELSECSQKPSVIDFVNKRYIKC